jgi:hypothetical protein
MYEGLRTNLSANYAKRTQSRKRPKSPQPQSPQGVTAKQRSPAHPKTNPNEPKRTQSKPNFSPKNGPQSQNEPKRTQFIAAKLDAKPEQTQSCPPRRIQEPKNTMPFDDPSKTRIITAFLTQPAKQAVQYEKSI